MDPKISNFGTIFGTIWGAILEPRVAPEGDQTCDHFWNRLAPHLRGLALAFSGIIREVWKSYWNWNYIVQKKGRDHDIPFMGLGISFLFGIQGTAGGLQEAPGPFPLILIVFRWSDGAGFG